MSEREGAEDRIVLIVEDDPSIAELVQQVVEGELGVRTVVAKDGERALALAYEAQPDVVLLDVNLPKVSGLEVARRLKSDPETREVALVAMTSMPEAETIAAGCSDHLAKPFDLDDLIGLVGKHLGFASKIPRTVFQRQDPARQSASGEHIRYGARRLCDIAKELQAKARALCSRAASARLRSVDLVEVAKSHGKQGARTLSRVPRQA